MRILTVLAQILLLLVLAGLTGLYSWHVRTDAVPLSASRLTIREERNEAHGIATVDVAKAMELWREDKALFVDAREAFAFAQGHIPGAFSCPPIQQDSLGSVLDAVQDPNQVCDPAATDYVPPSLPQGKLIVVYCDALSCGLSDKVAEMLKAQGHDVAVMPEGIEGWMTSGGRIEGAM